MFCEKLTCTRRIPFTEIHMSSGHDQGWEKGPDLQTIDFLQGLLRLL